MFGAWIHLSWDGRTDGWMEGWRGRRRNKRCDAIKRKKKEQICYILYLIQDCFSITSGLPAPIHQVCKVNWEGIRWVAALGWWDSVVVWGSSSLHQTRAEADEDECGDRCSLPAAAHWAAYNDCLERLHATAHFTNKWNNTEGTWRLKCSWRLMI